MIKVAMLSFWHVHAKDYAAQVESHPDTEITAIWDEIPERGKAEAEKRGVKYFDRLEDLLEDSSIDGVVIDTPTNLHRDVMVSAALNGKHIFTEKVIATTVKEAREIIDVARENGVKLTVSLPRRNEGYTLAIEKIISQELLGDLTLVRTRLSHDGALAGWLPEHFYTKEECGGGALIDLGCHPMYLARLFLGLPDSVSATFGYVTSKEVEDNAVAVLKYPNGAAAVVEAGFVTARSPFFVELHGTKGSLIYGAPETDRLYLSEAGKPGWQELPLEQDHPTAFEQWVQHIQDDTEATENLELALDLTRLMEAAYRSVRESRPVPLADLK
ncbi:Gfo/Idh/MocA family protein [Gorillibacterium timonense]|uniref:Gfo/Idh/MocA family protein n=1 Tax=Gorillibacterium timonense TaxID=1689269 RepID=UPI00071D54EE|nr:Gfo/Idh/MocA family oxidoreductase [Gorillibacterium timonense]